MLYYTANNMLCYPAVFRGRAKCGLLGFLKHLPKAWLWAARQTPGLFPVRCFLGQPPPAPRLVNQALRERPRETERRKKILSGLL